MKVLLDSRPSVYLGGVGRYSRCLLRALRETAAGEDEVLDSKRPTGALRGRSVDVLHAPWIDGAMLHSPCPMVVTIHDLSALKRRSELLRTSLRLRLRPLALQRAAGVIAPSEAVASDAVELLHIDSERVTVIPQAADERMRERSREEVAEVRARLELPERYMVWVGDLRHPDPRAHLAKLAAARRELALVLVGATRPWAHELPNVKLTGELAEEDLAAVYSGAHALVVSSEQEGFGLAAVEALSCGTPVAACEGAALRELLDSRASFVAAGDMQALVAAAEACRRPAPAPPAYTWRRAAQATWAVYERARAESRTPRSTTRALRRRPTGGLAR